MNRGCSKVLVPLELAELRLLNEGRIPASAIYRFERALGLIETATCEIQAWQVALIKPKRMSVRSAANVVITPGHR